MTTLTQATPGQLKQVTRVGTDAVEKAIADFGLDKDGAQRVHAHGDEFAEVVRKAVTTVLKDLSVSDKFKNEEVQSNWDYPKAFKAKGIVEQTNILRQFFPGVGFADEKLAEAPLHKGLNYFAIPKWKTIGGTYEAALLNVLAAIAKQRKFYNYREGALGADRLRLTKRTTQFLEKIAAEQKDHDIMVIPAQFGIKHRGRSVRRAIEVMSAEEFGLDPFSVAIMILTHPERFEKYEDLCADCAGGEYDYPGGTARWSSALCFDFSGDKLCLSSRQLDVAGNGFGSASGFSPQ